MSYNKFHSYKKNKFTILYNLVESLNINLIFFYNLYKKLYLKHTFEDG